MRTLPLAVLAVLPLAGCEWGFVSPFSQWGNDDSDWWGDTGGYYNDPYLRDADGMSQVSTAWMQSDGVAFTNNGGRGVAGVSGMACAFQTSTGNIDVDVSPSGDGVVIEDGDDSGGGLVVISVGASQFQLLSFGDGRTTQTFPISGVVGARFEEDGIVYGSQDDGCHVGWTSPARDVQVGVMCGGFDANPNGTAYIAADGTVKVVSPSGNVSDTGQAAQLVAWDDVHEVLYTALLGGDEVTAVTTSGTVRWTASFDDGEITSLTDMGARGAALVGLSVGEIGRLVALDGADGAEIAFGEASVAPSKTWVSPDGSTIAVRTASDWMYSTPLLRME